jgi:hypothetical protein
MKEGGGKLVASLLTLDIKKGTRDKKEGDPVGSHFILKYQDVSIPAGTLPVRLRRIKMRLIPRLVSLRSLVRSLLLRVSAFLCRPLWALLHPRQIWLRE